jgi:hypothetical protein
VSVHKRASQPVYGIAKQKRGFASLSFSLAYVIENGGTSMCRVCVHPFTSPHGHDMPAAAIERLPQGSLSLQD